MFEGTKISIVMATCNGASFIDQQLESIVGQTRPPDEIVVVDDLSEDETVELVRSYSDKCNLKIYVNERRLGPVKNFERGLQRASGDLIFFSDQDDVWNPEKIEKFCEFGDCDFLYSDGRIIDEGGRILFDSELNDFCKQAPLEGSPFFHFLLTNTVSGHGLMISRTLAEKALPFPDFVMYDKWLALVASSVTEIRYLDEQLHWHRLHQANFINNKKLHERKKGSRRDRFLERNTTFSKICEELVSRGIRTSDIEILEQHCRRFAESFFDYRLFSYLLKKSASMYPGKSLYYKVDRLIKLSKCARGHWLPGIKF